MNASPAQDARIAALEARIDQLEARLDALGASRAASGRRAAGAPALLDAGAAAAWTRPYRVAELEVSETWIELHEASARPQLQRLIRQVVDEEGPATEHLVLDRVRRAWGLRRAGGRVQEAFDQAVRQLLARSLVERDGDALRAPSKVLDAVRIPSSDEATRRGAEDVPLVELQLALVRMAQAAGGAVDPDELTMAAAKLFGWTRRGGAIQERLDAALARAEEAGELVRDGSQLRAAA